MKPRFPHHSEALAVVPDSAAAAAAERIAPSQPEFHACCCPGRPVVRVIMPASVTRPSPVDLLLCGHHYRVSQEAITAAHGTVQVLPERSADAAAALLINPAVRSA
jgi:hypothetical protein